MFTHRKSSLLLLDRIKKLIDKSEIISFDIFDTLLVRPYLRPQDLFLHLEKKHQKPNFHLARRDAECQALRKHESLQDITLEMIYEEIDVSFREMKQYELEWEKQVLRANPELQQVYDYAKELGKKIIILSDMYLPISFITEVLQGCGYDGWDKLYVSGDCGLSKSKGSMYQRLLAETGAKPRKILHIGDNRHSDVQMAAKFGICTVHYKALTRQYMDSIQAYHVYQKYKDVTLGESITLSMMAWNWQLVRCGKRPKQSYWQDLGYRCAGPAAYGYTRYVESVAHRENVNTLYFVARDGYLLQKVFQSFNKECRLHYVYAPRFIRLICNPNTVELSTKEQQAVINYYVQKNEELATAWTNNNDSPRDFLIRHHELFTKLMNEQIEKYHQYLGEIKSDTAKCAVVDTVTENYSAQKMLEAAYKKELLGIYWIKMTDKEQERFWHHSMGGTYTEELEKSKEHFLTKHWSFVEFLLSSPEPPIKMVDADGNPVYSMYVPPYERYREEIYPKLADGALLFARDVYDRFAGTDIFFTFRGITRWLNAYLKRPSARDLDHMSKIYFAGNTEHTEYNPMLCVDIHDGNIRTVLRRLRGVLWRSPLQTLLLCVTNPVSCYVRGFKIFTFSFLPFLNRNYLSLSLNISKKCYYSISIGKIKKPPKK